MLQMSSSILQEKDSISLLGLTVSSDLSWKSYLQKVSKKAAQRIGSLYRASRYLPVVFGLRANCTLSVIGRLNLVIVT